MTKIDFPPLFHCLFPCNNSVQERLQILRVHLSALHHNLDDAQQRELARRCHGYVGADLRSLCTTAARATLRAGKDVVDLESCYDACRQVPPSALKELLVEVPEVRWDDIGGVERVRGVADPTRMGI